MVYHWLCIRIARPGEPANDLGPRVVRIAKDKSQVAIEPDDGSTTPFGPVQGVTYRLSSTGTWVNTKHFDNTDDFQGIVTDTRLILSCQNYTVAKQGMRVGLLAIALSSKDHSWDESVLAGHVLWDWVMNVAVRSPVLERVDSLFASEGALVRLLVDRPEALGGGHFLIELHLPQQIDHHRLGQDIVSRVVRRRLATRLDLPHTDRDSLVNVCSHPAKSDAGTHTWTQYSLAQSLSVGQKAPASISRRTSFEREPQ